MHRHCEKSWPSRGHFFGRRGHRRFGHFLAGFQGGRGIGARGFRTGRKLAAGDLQLVLLALLADKPCHGYELIKALEERSNGFYSPSPGMIYPALTYLEEIEYLTVESEGTKKLYRLTDKGRAHLEENRASADAMLEQLAWIGRKMEHVRALFDREGSEESGENADTGARGGSRELREARRGLRRALLERAEAPREEQGRIAAILRRASEEIRGK